MVDYRSGGDGAVLMSGVKLEAGRWRCRLSRGYFLDGTKIVIQTWYHRGDGGACKQSGQLGGI